MKKEETKQVQFLANRVIVPHEEGGDPELEPLFANHLEVMQINEDVFLDIGIIKPVDIIAMVQSNASQSDEVPPPVQFYVLQRVAMSAQTLKTLYGKLCEVFGEKQINASTQQTKTAIEKSE